jgi:F-type H+-transporting ATPase subunit a
MDPSALLSEYIERHTRDGHHWALPFLDVHLPPFLTVHMVMLVIAGLLLYLLFGVLYRKDQETPHGLTNFLEVFVLFVRDEISVANLGPKDGRAFAPFFCSLFFFLLCLNLMGLIPLFSTATANVNVTAALATVTLGVMVVGGIAKNGVGGFLHTFMPSGVPWPILVILFPVEVLGMLIKPFALTIRLFANMLAGHIVLFSMIGLVGVFGLQAAVPAMVLGGAIYVLELLVAVLQAYIFTLLSAIFIGSFLHPEH